MFKQCVAITCIGTPFCFETLHQVLGLFLFFVMEEILKSVIHFLFLNGLSCVGCLRPMQSHVAPKTELVGNQVYHMEV